MTTRNPAKKDAPGAPRIISEHDWFYDSGQSATRRGILVVHEARDKRTGGHIQTDQFVIPWKMIEAAIARRNSRRTRKKGK